jgi:hypothetical protein
MKPGLIMAGQLDQCIAILKQLYLRAFKATDPFFTDMAFDFYDIADSVFHTALPFITLIALFQLKL